MEQLLVPQALVPQATGVLQKRLEDPTPIDQTAVCEGILKINA